MGKSRRTRRKATKQKPVVVKKEEFFPGIPKIKYEGPDSKNPLAFKHYNPKERVLGKTMAEHLRFSVCF